MLDLKWGIYNQSFECRIVLLETLHTFVLETLVCPDPNDTVKDKPSNSTNSRDLKLKK